MPARLRSAERRAEGARSGGFVLPAALRRPAASASGQAAFHNGWGDLYGSIILFPSFRLSGFS